MQQHWKILVWLIAGVILGIAFQQLTAAPGYVGSSFSEGEAGTATVVVDNVSRNLKPKGRSDSEALQKGDVISRVILNAGMEDEVRLDKIENLSSLTDFLSEVGAGGVVSIVLEDGTVRSSQVILDPQSDRSRWLYPFVFLADIFMRLLKMLIMPLVFTSIVTGVAGLGGGEDFGRLGRRTFGYYVTTSFLAVGLGLVLVNLIRPGEGAQLGLSTQAEFGQASENWLDILRRMVPENVFEAFTGNGNMLQVIFFALLFGFFITRAPEKPRKFLTELLDSAFQVVMLMASWVMKLVPYGVFCLLVKVVGETGFDIFIPLSTYMLTVFLALVIHAGVVLPILLKVVGGVSPLKWFRAMSPVLMTAFSTSSSSLTLPTTLNTLKKRGRVSTKTSSFVAPLGATVNMDGTALYECIGVVFLAQYYASTGDFVLTFGSQVTVVMAAFLASIGAAGIPSAGLIMMLTILSALKLPLEGAALLLAVDRPLDMCRTMVNVWSDTVGSAIVASKEGETGLGEFKDSATGDSATGEAA
ncbi:dicarboxylate/amino acid:cation symporter [Planctomycetota bacterium]|nr:dicarboxylate/amino acid:cation symporter [Planctomycetota bacterium]